MLTIALGIALLSGCAAQKKPQPKPAAFWPPYPDEPRVQYLVSFAQSSDVSPKKSSLDELIYGKETQQVLAVRKPYGLKMYDGKVYVCDLRNACVTVLDLRKRQTLILGKTGADTLESPSDIAISPDGIKYVADTGKGRIYVFGQDDRQLGSFAPTECKPAGIAVFQNELFVCDFKSQRVLVLDRTSGSVTRTIGEPGNKPGQFIRPLGITVDDQGNIYVTDVLKCQMQKFSHDGKLVTSFGIISANAGGFVRPKHIAVDKEGQIYVVDAAFQNVQIFDQVGRPLTFFGSAGNHPGAMYLPAGITVHDGDVDLFAAYIHPAFDAQRLILVTNQFGDNKIAVYALGHLKPGKTVQDIAASQGIVPTGTGEAKTKGPGAALTQPTAPGDEDTAPLGATTRAAAATQSTGERRVTTFQPTGANAPK
jgi:hypothetical protein